MSPECASEPTLVCPACRRAEAGDLYVQTLDPIGGMLGCACGALHPVVDGIPLVWRDLDGWLRSEGAEALRRTDLPDDLARRLAIGAGGALARNSALLSAYLGSREGPLQAWWRERAGLLEGLVLELGCGIGATDRADIVGLDANLALLRHHPGRVRICGDAADPPFLPGAFDAILLPNLLDSCADPALVLAQADALLRPGGQLLLSCAYAFRDEVTPRARWFSPDALAAALDGGPALGGYPLRHRLSERTDRIDWPIRVNEREVHTHAAQVLISQKLPLVPDPARGPCPTAH